MNGRVEMAIKAAGLLGPGLPDWSASQPVLTGARPYRPEPLALPLPLQLSSSERRRAIPSVKLALAVASAAIHASGENPLELAAVFASSGADGQTVESILTALATPDREVSPTRFGNSVHNAAAGAWGLATQSQQPATSICAHDATFAAGLLEAATQVISTSRPVLFVAYDLPYPSALHAIRPILDMFGVGFVLAPTDAVPRLGTMHLRLTELGAEATNCADPVLEALRRGNPAARSLPLLEVLAKRRPAVIRLDLPRGSLLAEVEPC